MIRIVAVRVLSHRRVELGLTDGRTIAADLEPLLHGSVSDAIREHDDVFATVRVDPEFGTIAWANGADLCPDARIHDLPPA